MEPKAANSVLYKEWVTAAKPPVEVRLWGTLTSWLFPHGTEQYSQLEKYCLGRQLYLHHSVTKTDLKTDFSIILKLII